MTPAAQEMVLRWQHLCTITARACLKRLRPGSLLEMADLEGAGYFGLCRAAETFDPSRGVQFQTHAIHKIRGAMLEHIRSLSFIPRVEFAKRRAAGLDPAPEPVSLDTPTGHRSGDFQSSRTATFGDLLVDERPGPEEIALQNVAREELLAAVRRLPEREQRCIVAYFQEGLTHKAIGAELGVSEARALQIHREALGRLRMDLSADFDDVLCDRPGEV